MKAVIQRVTTASVTVDGELISSIEKGYMLLLGVMKGDTEKEAELLARKRRAPANVFLIPGVIPTVPGSNLYFLMRNILESNMPEAITQLSVALGVAIGIACGTVSVSITWGIVSDKISKRKAKRAQS